MKKGKGGMESALGRLLAEKTGKTPGRRRFIVPLDPPQVGVPAGRSAQIVATYPWGHSWAFVDPVKREADIRACYWRLEPYGA